MKIQAIIFDMDGLMFDSERFWLEKGQELIKKFGYVSDISVVKKALGTNKEKTKEIFLEAYSKDFPFDDFYDEYVAYILEIVKKEGTPIKKGLISLIKYLKENNYKMAIASSSKYDKIYSYVDNANIDRNIFDVIMSGQNVKRSKPDPEIFLKTIQELNVKPENTLILEDSNNGIKAAYNSGAIPILIPDLDIITEENEKLVYKKLNNLSEVIQLLENH